MKSEEDLRRRTGEAARRFAEAARAPSGTGPAPGDLYVSEESAAYPVQWLVLGPDPERPGRLEVVATDSSPLAGSADVKVPATVPGGPLTLRSRFRVSVEPRHLAPENRVGSLPESFLLRVRERAAVLASGAYQPTVLEEEADADPEYREWVAEVLKPAQAALAAGGRSRSSEREPKTRPTGDWPRALAAVFLMTSIGLSVWVVELRREVDFLSAPEVVSEPVEVVVGDPPRTSLDISISPGARYVLIEFTLQADQLGFDRYRLGLRDMAGRELLANPAQLHPEKGVLRLLLPLARLPMGEYTLTVQGESRGSLEKLDERRVILKSKFSALGS